MEYTEEFLSVVEDRRDIHFHVLYGAVIREAVEVDRKHGVRSA